MSKIIPILKKPKKTHFSPFFLSFQLPRIFKYLGTAYMLTGCASLPSISENAHPQVTKLHQAINNYQMISREPWPLIKTKTPLKEKETNPNIPLLKKRLVLLKDWPSHCEIEYSNQYNACMKKAVANFQARHGLKSDGILGQQTLQELNIPPKQRISTLLESANQWKTLPVKSAPPYLLVNIPAYELKAINQGKTELSMRVIVGKPTWPTPTMSSTLQTVELNPGWNVPVNIAEKEIIQKVLENPNYLEEHHLKIVESWKPDAKEINPHDIDWEKYAGPAEMPYRLVQAPSEESALGKIKFIFPNKEHIYLHDTPIKSLFNLPDRDLSHGCIRLEKPMALLSYLGQKNSNLADEKVKPYLESNETKYLALNKKMPLHIAYIQAWVDDQGRVQFRRNIYPQQPPNNELTVD